MGKKNNVRLPKRVSSSGVLRAPCKMKNHAGGKWRGNPGGILGYSVRRADPDDGAGLVGGVHVLRLHTGC